MRSKSILVIDTPKSCLECDVLDNDELTCLGCKVHFMDIGKVQSWCPLKPLPKPKDEHTKLDNFNWELESIINAENRGFNKCLEELLGEE